MSDMDHRIIPFHMDHLSILDLRPQEKEELDADPNLLTKIAQFGEYGLAWTLIAEGRVICIAGWMKVYNGVFETWSLPSIYVKEYRYARLYLTQLVRFRKILEAEFTPHRIQSASIADPETDHFMRFCGFTEEGIMPMYSANKKTYKMWGRTYGVHE